LILSMDGAAMSDQQDCRIPAKRALADITNERTDAPRCKIPATSAGFPLKGDLAAFEEDESEPVLDAAKPEDLQRLLDRGVHRLHFSERVMAVRSCLHLQQEQPEDLAAADADDPQLVSEYSGDIFSKLGRDEEDFSVLPPDFLQDQPELSGDDRASAVDWLIEVQVKYKLRTETLFLAVGLFDRYLSRKKVKQADLQLVAVTSIFLASKFEEIDPLDARDFVHMTQQACARQDILNMEARMLSALEFGLCRPTPVHFIDRYQRANESNQNHRFLLEYFLQLALVELSMCRYTPSQQVSASLLVISRLTGQSLTWPEALLRDDHSEHHQTCVMRCATELCRILEAAEQSPHQAARQKFLKQQYNGAAGWVTSKNKK